MISNTNFLRRAYQIRRWLVVLALFLPFGPLHAGESGFDWNTWANAVNESPCQWLPKDKMTTLLGGDYATKADNSRSSTSCQWKTADGVPVITLSIHSLDNAKQVNDEREAQLAQIRDHANGRFQPIESPRGVTTAILRKDRLIVSLFANSDKEAAMIRLQGHPILKETPEQKKARRERLVNVTRALIEHFKF